LDDLGVEQAGERIDQLSVIALPVDGARIRFPDFAPAATDPFLQQIHASGKKWVILTDPGGEPQLVMDADGFLREVWFGRTLPDPAAFCHRPIVVRDTRTQLGHVLGQLQSSPWGPQQDVIDRDIILVRDNRR
jgi:hypothetical protein